MSDRKKVVYFMKPVGLPGPIKIGCAYNSKLRLADLARWSPLPLELIGQVDGDHTDEAFLHGCFFDLLSHGEWFFPAKALTDAIPHILSEGIAYARANFVPKGKLRSRGPRSPETRAKIGAGVRIQHIRTLNRIDASLRAMKLPSQAA